MVALFLGQVADPGNEVQGLLEVLEGKASLDTAPLVHEGPTGRLFQIAFGLGACQRRNTASTRRASLGPEIFVHSARSRKMDESLDAGDATLVLRVSSGLRGFERLAIPIGEIGRGFIAALKEREKLLVGIICFADGVIGQDKFA